MPLTDSLTSRGTCKVKMAKPAKKADYATAMKAEALSFDDIQRLLSEALVERLRLPKPDYNSCCVSSSMYLPTDGLTDSTVIYSHEGHDWRIGYSIDKKSRRVTFTDQPVEVRRGWVPV